MEKCNLQKLFKTKEEIMDELGDCPNEKYKKFFDSFKDIETLEVSQWKVSHLLGFFCNKYQSHYNIKYTFKFNSPSPSKCFEVFQVKKLGMLLSSNPTILKEYIDWAFLNKVPQAKRRLTSISFLTNEASLNEYKMNVLFSNKQGDNINRSTLLPEQYKTLFKDIGIAVNNYGDLAFLSQMKDSSTDMIIAFNKLKALNFDIEILKKII